jgi:hypothetical protein
MSDAILWLGIWLDYLGYTIEEVTGVDIALNERG